MRLHDDIHNYYEKIVVEEIIKRKLDEKYDDDVMADFCCTVLNPLLMWLLVKYLKRKI